MNWITDADPVTCEGKRPFTSQELLARVRTHLTMARSRDELNMERARATEEQKAFSYSVSHDLRAPLRAVDGYSQMLFEDYAGQLDDTGRDYVQKVRAGAQRRPVHSGRIGRRGERPAAANRVRQSARERVEVYGERSQVRAGCSNSLSVTACRIVV